MEQNIQTLIDLVTANEKISAEEKATLISKLKDADKKITITEFKLERTEKVKHTTAILLEETIEELEQKRKAVEAQNKELEIEAALERVRSRSLAMHKSEELQEVVATLFEILKDLGVEMDSANIAVFTEGKRDFEFWIASPVQNKMANFHMLEWNFPFLHELMNAKESGQDFFTVCLSFEEKNEWFNFAFENTDFRQINEDRRQYILASKAYRPSIAFSKNTGVQINNYSGKFPSESEIDILKRFAKVFEQAYTRFLDLQKAEAQAREAEIQLALERVRARTMAMQKQEDLSDVLQLLVEQLIKLGVQIDITNFSDGIPERDWNLWIHVIADDGTIYNNYVHFPRIDHPYFTCIEKNIEIYKNGGGDLFKDAFSKEEKDSWLDYIYTQTIYSEIVPLEVRQYFYHKPGYLWSVLVLKDTWVSICRFSTIPFSDEEDTLLRRFAQAFGLAYTRFLDLQKAEAQAREAQIQLSLERVRAKAIGMYHSEELNEVLSVLIKQFDVLEIYPVKAVLCLFDVEKNTFTFRTTGKAGQRIIGEQTVDINSNEVFKGMFEEWKNGKPGSLFTNFISQEELSQIWNFIPNTFANMPQEAWVYPTDYPDGLYNIFGYCKFGLIGFDHIRAATEEEKNIVIRFANEFERLYQRFLDLQKAEAQAREAQIEAALERVRSSSLAMHKSEDIQQVVHELYTRLLELNIRLDAANILFFKEGSRDIECWTGNNLVKYQQATFPYADHDFLKELNEAHENGSELLKGWYNKEKKDALFKYLFEETELKLVPADRKRFVFSGYHHAYSTALVQNVGVNLNRYFEEPFSAEEDFILKRFCRVFHQAYTRFLDLQKAEAQAREAEIELALERVRARAMSMQKSDELKELIGTVFTELTKLDLVLTRCVIMIYDIKTNGSTWWMANSEAPSDPIGLFVKYHDHIPYQAYINAWKEKNLKWQYTLEGIIKKEWDDFLFAQTELSLLPDFVIEGMKAPERVYLNASFNSFGNLTLASLKPLTDEHFDILLRFAKVFDLTYTRFNDLKQAEAQAREAKIEAALERVRAQTMAMHDSNDVTSATEIMFDELRKLGLDNLRCGIANIHHNKTFDVFGVTNLTGGDKMSGFGLFGMDEHPIWQRWFESWKNKEEVFIAYLAGQEKEEYFNNINNHNNYLPQRIINFPDNFFQAYYFEQGSVWAYSLLQHSEPEKDIMKRFATGFSLTFRRYQDLKKAEAQAREAQIQLALERVRARTMAMQYSSELSETASVVFQQLVVLGLEPNRSFICTFKNEAKQIEMWTTTEDGKKLSQPFFIDPGKLKIFQNVVTDWKQKKQSFVIDLQDKALENYLRYLQNELNIPFIQDQKRRVMTAAFFSNGYIGMSSGEPQSEEIIQLLQRFASAFDLSYTRFLDLQKAEAQAREAQIEAALERVRARTMAMFKSDELSETAVVVFQQLISLGIEPNRLYIGIIKDESGDLEFWITDEKGKQVSNRYVVNIHKNISIKKMYDGWKEQQSTLSIDMSGNELQEWITYWNKEFGVPFIKGAGHERRVQNLAYFSKGFIATTTFENAPKETVSLLNRFAAVFNLTYTRFNDLQQAETNAKEATIEAALERVRAKAMAMHNSNDLSSTASVVFTELRKLGISPIRCGVGLLRKETRKAQLYSAVSSDDGDGLALVGWVMLSDHPVLKSIYHAWLEHEDYFPQLTGEQLKSYYEELLKGLSVKVPGWQSGEKQYGHFFSFSIGCLYAWSETPYTDSQIIILKRFATIVDLTFRRYIELQKSEASAKEAIRQASLDRVRAEIASMRTTNDLEKITPLIWNELNILGVPFIRCGVFLMDDSQKLIHTFLSTPDGKAIAAFHLPYDTPGNFAEVVKRWHNKQIYIDHWGEPDFISIADILVKQGAIATREQYLDTLPVDGFYLHFLPFLQGMLYVGNTTQLAEEEIKLIQSVADAFSTAYARYEDFNKLESAKQQIEKTLVDLKQTQAQLVQSEKMASLGELTAGIAHEIQNPLNFVNNFSEVNKELLTELNEEIEKGNYEEVKLIAKDVINNEEKINHHGKRADAIVKGMLQHSRSSSATKEATNINTLADEYLRLAYHGLRAKDKSFNATLKTDFDETIGKINIIPQDIGRVILNLIMNAFYTVAEKKKQSPDHYEPTVSVTTKKINDKIEVSIRDNGNGIPAKVIDKIFQPFFTTKPTGQGTGLGLSLAYDIIKTHNGELKVETKEGEGSEFIIQLPVV